MDIQVLFYDETYFDVIKYNITHTMYEDILDNNVEASSYTIDIIFKFENNIKLKLHLFEPINIKWIELYNGKNITIRDEYSRTIISSNNGIVKIEQLNETYNGSTMTFTLPLDTLRPYIQNYMTVIKQLYYLQ